MIRFGRNLFLLFVAAGLTAGCDFTEEAPDIQILVPRDVSSSQYTTTESGLKYYDFEVGDGALADSTSEVQVHYSLWLTNDRLVSTSQSRENPVAVDLGAAEVIEGFAEGVPGMRVGGDRQLVVPPELAYGSDGLPQAGIPPDATLVYEIELVSIGSE